MKPLCIDLFCGLGGWADGFLSEGYDVVGFDIERHDYGTGGYPGQFVLQDVLTLAGRQFRGAAVIVASPPCQEYSYMAMPWSLAKKKAAWYREDYTRRLKLMCLFNACFRIAHEAGVPLVVENVRGAEPWVGRARYHYGSFYLWGDIPALMPKARASKVPSFRFDGSGGSFQTAAVNGVKNSGHDMFYKNGVACGKLTDPRYGLKGFAKRFKDTPMAQLSSAPNGRKAASAQIAKIPFPLSSHIARVFKPHTEAACA